MAGSEKLNGSSSRVGCTVTTVLDLYSMGASLMVEPRERIEPGWDLAEREMLEAWLDYHRATLWNKCSGLTDEQLKQRAVSPSPISLLGLVRHMTDVERGWFARTLSGEANPPIYYSDDDPDGDFERLDSRPVEDVFREFSHECERSRSLVQGEESLDVKARSRKRSADALPTLRWIMTHMIEEYARHNGHADFLRERLDGQTGD